MRIWSISDIGLVRHENQDACGTMLIGEYTAAVVCDGMGGTDGGAVASHLAVATYREQLYAAVMALPEKQAKRIYARYYLGMRVSEIAAAEGVDPSRVRDSIRRGLK